MAKQLQYRRLFWLALLLCAAFAGLGYRLVDLQVVRHVELKAKAAKNTQREFLLEPRRGDILDVKGNLLATTVDVKTVCADPRLVGESHLELARLLAPLLNENESRLAAKLQDRWRTNALGEVTVRKCVILKKRVPVETWDKVQQAIAAFSFGLDETRMTKAEARKLKSRREGVVFAQPEQMRVYPQETLAAHVLGFTGIEDKEINERPVTQIVGRDGIELTLDEKLAGVRGWRVTETDRNKNELVALREQNVEPRDGFNVVLTIDSVVQHILEAELAAAKQKHDPISICGMVVRPKTGEILGMATLPNFDANRPGGATRNRMVTDQVEPGSTFKIVVVSAALNEDVVKLTDLFDCENGRFHYAGRTLHDHHPLKILSVERIVTKSSNIGAAKIGIKLGEKHLYDYMKAFGFGARTGLPLLGESAGTVHPVNKWSKVSIAQIPMGHGVAVTPLQMTMAMCAIANKGVLMRPMLVDRLEENDHTVVAKYAPQRVRQVISEETARQMVTALKTVVTPEGTAAKAALDHYTAAGKTGTAQKVENGTYVRKYIASFIGFFPADDPELCISVFLDEPRIGGSYGGETAGPAFKQIAERVANYLSIRPDLSTEVAALRKPAVEVTEGAGQSSSGGQ